MSVNMTDGAPAEKDSQNALLPPVDTGESIGLGASKLTLTYGISKSFLKRLVCHQKSHLDLKIYHIFLMTN